MMIDVQIGPRKETYLLVKTNAPRAYDSGAAIELADVSYSDTIERYLLVPKGDILWQQSRNASGLHSFETEELMIDELEIALRLWQKMFVPNLTSHLRWALECMKAAHQDSTDPFRKDRFKTAEQALVQAERI